MRTTFDTFAINTIKFTSHSGEIRVIGTCQQDNLSYETELRLEQTILNVLINQIQRLNPEVEVTSLLESEALPEGEFHYSLSVCELNNTLPFYNLVEDRTYKQIRA
jgi:hypothetical protein